MNFNVWAERWRSTLAANYGWDRSKLAKSGSFLYLLRLDDDEWKLLLDIEIKWKEKKSVKEQEHKERQRQQQDASGGLTGTMTRGRGRKPKSSKSSGTRILGAKAHIPAPRIAKAFPAHFVAIGLQGLLEPVS